MFRLAPHNPVNLAFCLKDNPMHDERPSKSAYKVALNILTLGAMPEMAEVLPAGIVDATARLLIALGVTGERTSLSRSSFTLPS